MATVHLLHPVRLKCPPFRYLPTHLDPTLHYLPEDMECNGAPSRPKLVPRHISNGTCNNCQYDRLRLRAVMGR